MANWGRPDFDGRTAEQQKIDSEAPALRARLAAKGELVEWPHNDRVDRGYNPQLVKIHCVQNAAWQKIRLSMKGKTTADKLAILKRWWDKHIVDADLNKVELACEVQVGNYLGALRRGGQLDDANRLRKEI